MTCPPGCRYQGTPTCRLCPHGGAAPKPSPTKAAKRRAGKRAQSGGRSWEATIEALLDILARHGMCSWGRTPEPLRRLKALGGGRWECVAEAKGPPDYVVMYQGHGLALEAKSTTGPRWGFRLLADHQAASLDEWERAGGVGAVAVKTATLEAVLPWRTLAPAWWAWRREGAGRGGASLGTDNAGQLGAIPLDVDGRWLEALR